MEDIKKPEGVAEDAGCICQGNWRAIVSESEPLLDKIYLDKNGGEHIFFGVVHAKDDYYYGLLSLNGGKQTLLSCVCDIETCGFTLKEGQ